MSRPRKELLPGDITAIIDTREQLPLTLGLRTIRGTLPTGDYSVVGLEHCVAIERKSLSDLLGCIGNDRERFEREIQRLRAYETRALVIEATWDQIAAGGWPSKVTPQAAWGSLVGWIEKGIPCVLAGNREKAAQMVGHLLFTAARRRWRLLHNFEASLKLVGRPEEASSQAETHS